MGKTFDKGDRVSWSYRGASKGKKIVGTVLRRITSTKTIKGHAAKATPLTRNILSRATVGGRQPTTRAP